MIASVPFYNIILLFLVVESSNINCSEFSLSCHCWVFGLVSVFASEYSLNLAKISAMLFSKCRILRLVSWWYLENAWLRLIIFFSGLSLLLVIVLIIASGDRRVGSSISGPFPLSGFVSYGS
jgi:hypothetical protein